MILCQRVWSIRGWRAALRVCSERGEPGWVRGGPPGGRAGTGKDIYTRMRVAWASRPRVTGWKPWLRVCVNGTQRPRSADLGYEQMSAARHSADEMLDGCCLWGNRRNQHAQKSVLPELQHGRERVPFLRGHELTCCTRRTGAARRSAHFLRFFLIFSRFFAVFFRVFCALLL